MTHPRVTWAKMLRKLIAVLAALVTLVLVPTALAQTEQDKTNLKLAYSQLDRGSQQRASRSEVWELRWIQAESTQAATAELPQPAQPRIHVVQPGEGLADLARIYGVDWRRIYDANPVISDTDYRLWIYPGQELRIPDASEELQSRPLPQPPPPPPPRTQGASSGGGGGSSPGPVTGDVWYRLRVCESGNDYTKNTGNGYYGAYQFALGTWQGLGYSGYPHQASPAVQDEAARRLQARSGWGQWPSCSRQLGLR